MSKLFEEKRGILDRINDRSLSLTSDLEFQQLKDLFPDRGEISRAYADFLLEQNQKEKAYRSYTYAADLFLRNGKTFQAIVSTMLAWRIGKPTHGVGHAFHTSLQNSIREESPLRHLFSGISYPELLAFMLKLVRTYVDTNKYVTRTGQDCQYVFFVVSGELEEHVDPVINAQNMKSSPSGQILQDNDIFGDIFPLQEATVSLSDVKACTPSELVKIDKTNLMGICQRYPDLEHRLAKLYKGPPSIDYGRSWSSVRRSIRHENPVRTTVMLSLREEDHSPVAFEGMSKDISLGGACIDLGLKYGSMRPDTFAGIEATVQINLPSGVGVSIPGHVTWCKKVNEPAGTSIVAGIRFAPLPHDVRDFLEVYCFGHETEQSLMWALWEEYIK